MWSCRVIVCVVVSSSSYQFTDMMKTIFCVGVLQRTVYLLCVVGSEKFDISSSSDNSQFKSEGEEEGRRITSVSGVSWVVIPPVGRGVVRIDRSHNNSNLISLFDVVVDVPYIVICTLPFVRLYNRSQSTVYITILILNKEIFGFVSCCTSVLP